MFFCFVFSRNHERGSVSNGFVAVGCEKTFSFIKIYNIRDIKKKKKKEKNSTSEED